MIEVLHVLPREELGLRKWALAHSIVSPIEGSCTLVRSILRPGGSQFSPPPGMTGAHRIRLETGVEGMRNPLHYPTFRREYGLYVNPYHPFFRIVYALHL